MIAAALRSARKELNLSQADLADTASVSQSAISLLENATVERVLLALHYGLLHRCRAAFERGELDRPANEAIAALGRVCPLTTTELKGESHHVK
jgi:transcriptional regulator with XRE-family HTH domain